MLIPLSHRKCFVHYEQNILYNFKCVQTEAYIWTDLLTNIPNRHKKLQLLLVMIIWSVCLLYEKNKSSYMVTPQHKNKTITIKILKYWNSGFNYLIDFLLLIVQEFFTHKGSHHFWWGTGLKSISIICF